MKPIASAALVAAFLLAGCLPAPVAPERAGGETKTPAARAGADLVGPVTRVRDGDTIVVGSSPVRLNGLHAPELSEPYGAEAQTMMTRIVAGQTISCDLTGERSYDRVIGTCYDEKGQDVAVALLEAGLGRDCRRYSGGRYGRVETDWARAQFVLPGYC